MLCSAIHKLNSINVENKQFDEQFDEQFDNLVRTETDIIRVCKFMSPEKQKQVCIIKGKSYLR